MASNAWLGVAGNWNDGTKWSLGVKPTTGDDVIFYTGSGNCTVNEAPATLNSIAILPAYTGTFAASTYAFTVSGLVYLGGTAFSASGTWTQTGDGDFRMVAGTFTVTSMSIVLQGTGTLVMSVASTRVASITCAASGKTTTWSSTSDLNSGATGAATLLTLGSGTFVCKNYITLACTGTCTPYSASSATIIFDGTAINTAGIIIIVTGGTTPTISLPAITATNSATGTGQLVITPTTGSTATTFNMTGAITAPTLRVDLDQVTGHIFNTGNYAITTTGKIYFGNVRSAALTMTFNMGSSTITCGGYESISGTYTLNTGLSTLNLQTSTWIVKGDWAFGSNQTVNNTSATITFNTNSATITTATKTFPALTFNEVGKTYTISGALTCTSINVTSGAFNQNAQAITVNGGNASFGGSDTLTLNTTFTMSNSGSTFTVTNSGTKTTGSCVLTLSNNMTLNTGTLTISRLVLTAAKTYTFNTGCILTISAYTANDWAGTAGNVINWVSSSAGTRYKVIPSVGTATNISYLSVTDCDSTGTYGCSIGTGGSLSNTINWGTYNVWIGTTTNGNLGSNWSRGALASTDALVWSTNSVVNCTFTATISCTTLTVLSGYTGTLNDGGFAVAVVNGVSLTPGGTFISSGTWTQSGDGDFTLTNNGTYSTASMNIVLQGTGSLTFAKTATTILINSLTCAASGKTTKYHTGNYTSGIQSATGPLLTLGSGTLLIDTSVYASNNFLSLFPTGSVSVWSVASATITLNGGINAGIYVYGNANVTVTIPALTAGGTGIVTIANYTGASTGITFNQTGAISVPIYRLANGSGAAGTCAYNSNNNAITTSGVFYIGTTSTSKNITCAFGSSTVNCGSLDVNTYAQGGSTTFTSSGSWNIAGTMLWNPTSSGSSFTTSGTWTQTADGNFTLSAVGTYSISTLNVVLQGTGTYTLSSAGVYIASLTCAASSKTTTIGCTVTNSGVAGSTGNLVTLGGGQLNTGVSKYLVILCTGTCTPIYAPGASTIVCPTLNYGVYIPITSGTATITIPSISASGPGYVFYQTISATGSVTFNQTGTVSFGSYFVLVYTGTTGTGHVYNTNNNSITVTGTFYTGSNIAAKDLTFNCGSSAIAVGSFDNSTYGSTGPSTIAFGTSTWVCKGSWTYGANTTVTNTSASITFNTNSATLTTASKTFPSLIFNGVGKTYTHSGALTCSSLTVTNGIFTQAAAITVTGGNSSFAGSDALTLNNTFTMSNSGSSFIVTNSGTKTTSSCVLTLTQNMTINPGTLTISRLVLTAGKTYTFTATTCTLTINAFTFGDWSGTVGNVITWVSSSPGTQYHVINTLTTTAVGKFLSVTDCDSTGGSWCAAQTISNTVMWSRLNIWSSTASTNGNLGTNWSQGSLTSTDTLFYDNSCAINCTFTAPISCSSIVCPPSGLYAGAFNDGGFAFTIAGSVYIYMGGTITCAGVWTQTGDGDFLLNSSGTYTTTNMQIVLQGSGTFFEGSTTASIAKLTCAASGKTTLAVTQSTSGISGSSGTLVTLGGGTFRTAGSFYIVATGSCTPLNAGSSTIDLPTYSLYIYVNGATSTITLPAMTCTGAADVRIAVNAATGTVTFNQTGTISTVGALYLGTVIGGSGDNHIYNTNNNSIVCGYNFYIGASVAKTITYNYGSSTCNVSYLQRTGYTSGTVSLTTTGDWSVSNVNWVSGSLTASGTWTMPNAAGYLILAAAGTYSVSSMKFDLQGSGNTLILGANNMLVSKITCAYPGFTTNFASFGTGCGVSTSVNDGLLTMGGSISSSTAFYIDVTGSCAPYTIAGAGFFQSTGTGSLTIRVKGSSLTCTLNSLNFVGSWLSSLSFIFSSGSGSTITLAGNLTATARYTYIYEDASSTASTSIFNSSNYTINLGSLSALYLGSASASGGITYNFGSSAITIGSNGYLGSTYNTTTCIINMSTSQWSCAGSWTWGTNSTVNEGSSLVTFTRTVTLTPNGKNFHDITISSGTTTLSGTLAMTGDLNQSATFNAGANAVNITGLVNCPGSLTASGTWTQSGDADFSMGAGGTYATTSMNIVLQGTGSLNIAKANTPINNLTCSASGKTTTWSGLGNGTTGGIGGVLTLGGGTLINNCAGDPYIRVVAQTAPIVMSSPTTITGTRRIVMTFANTTGLVVTLPAIAFTGTTNGIMLYKSAGAGTLTVNQNGNLNLGVGSTGNEVGIVAAASLGVYTHNTNNYALTVGSTVAWYLGSPSVAANVVVNFGSSTVTINIFSAAASYQYVTLNFQTSQWYVSGNWTFLASQTVSYTTPTITFTATSIITTAAKAFPALAFTGTGATYTLSGALTCTSISVTNGAFNQSAQAITVNGGNASFGGSDTLTLNTTFTMSNSGSSFTVTNSGTKTTSSCVLTLSNNITLNPGTLTISRLVLTANKTYTFTATTCVLTVNSYTTGDWAGTAGNIITWQSSSGGTRYKVNNATGAVIVSNYMSVTDCDSSGGTSCAVQTGGTLSNDINWYRYNIWSSVGSTNGNLGTNWSQGSLASTDALVWNNTSVVNCTLTATLTCGAITVASNYTGTLNDGGFAVNIAGVVLINTGGTFTASGTWTQTADGNFTLANSGTHSVASMSIVLQGTGTLTFAKTTAFNIKTLTCAAAGKTTTYNTGAYQTGPFHTVGPLVTFGSGTFYMDTSVYTNNYLSLYPKGSISAYSTSSTTFVFNGVSTGIIVYPYTSSTTVSLDAMTATGTGVLTCSPWSTATAGVTYSLAGAISVPNFRPYVGEGVGTTNVFNSNNYAITASVGIQFGSATAGKTITYNMGSSVVTCGSFNSAGATYNTGTMTLAFSTSTWTCKGAWTFGSNTTVTNTSASITFNTNSSTITTASKTFPSLIFNEAGKTYTHSGTLTCASLTVTNGIFTQAAAITVNAGNVSFGGSDALTLNNTLTMSNSGSSFIVTNSGTITSTSLVLTLSQNMTLNPGTLTVSRLVLTAGKTYTFTATTCILTVNSYTAATDWQGTVGNVITWVSSSPGTRYKVNNATGSNIVADYISVTDCDSSGGSRPCIAKVGSTLSNDINWYRANVWSAASGGVWSNTANWALSHVPTSSEVAYFDNTSVQACTVNTAPNIGGFLTTTGYKGAFSDGGYAFTVATTVTINTAGTLTLTGTWTQTGNGDFTLNSTTTVTATSMQVVLQGSGTFAINKASAYINKLTCSASGKTTTINGNASSGVRGGAGIFNLGTGTLIVTQNPWRIVATSTATCMTNAGATIQPSGSGSLNFSLGATSITHSIPAISNCSTPITIHNSATGGGTGTIDLAGNINSTSTFNPFGNVAGTTLTFNTNNYSVTCTIFTIGANASTSSLTANFGSSVMTVSAFTYQLNYAATINLNTSTWYCSGNWNIPSRWTFNSGASLVSITRSVSAGGITITSAAQSFHDFNINVSVSDNVNFSGAFIALGDFTITAAAGQVLFDVTNPSWTVYGNTTISNAPTVYTGGCIFYGNIIINTGSTVLFSQLAASRTIYFYGNVTFSPTSYVANYTTTIVYFAATSGTQEITMNGYASSGMGYVFHSGLGGTVKLMDAFRAYRLTLTSGTFNQNGQTITLDNTTGQFNWNSWDTATTINGTLVVSNVCSRGVISAGSPTGSTISPNNTTTLTSNGKTWYNLTSTTTLNLGDACICNDVTIGCMNTGGYALTCNNLICNNGFTLSISYSTVTVLGNFTMLSTASAPSFTITSATLVMGATTGTQTISVPYYTSTISFPATIFNTNLVISNPSSGVLTFNRITFGVDGKTLTLNSGKTYTITNLAQADWQGSSGARNVIKSSNAGSRATMAIPNTLALLSYVIVKDSALTGFSITADDGTSINAGNNNANWIFATRRPIAAFMILQDPGLFI